MRHSCKRNVKNYGYCRPCKEQYDAINEPKTPTSQPRPGSLADAASDYIRARLRETSFAWQILPPVRIQKQLERVWEIGSRESYVIPGQTLMWIGDERIL